MYKRSTSKQSFYRRSSPGFPVSPEVKRRDGSCDEAVRKEAGVGPGITRGRGWAGLASCLALKRPESTMVSGGRKAAGEGWG